MKKSCEREIAWKPGVWSEKVKLLQRPLSSPCPTGGLWKEEKLVQLGSHASAALTSKRVGSIKLSVV